MLSTLLFIKLGVIVGLSTVLWILAVCYPKAAGEVLTLGGLGLLLMAGIFLFGNPTLEQIVHTTLFCMLPPSFLLIGAFVSFVAKTIKQSREPNLKKLYWQKKMNELDEKILGFPANHVEDPEFQLLLVKKNLLMESRPKSGWTWR